ncbi:hypothetical protein M430DRAFT_36472 [Amorphotheca resinae ATCC 22711]|uniref:Uncharacterized protein n=1 Tax=Amorphotheca resinae ATCC 22711 TaxID=857342 RepID=A0A2T3AUH0_AMORE|nr:hypothetical protein M430DRAFT_36472 [Amorphotheca resinae ATCC 22711]PSS12298.1 hypothetical protein M430DRAFT_36472 [Amorphotheca resinae ATCC 22711]
MSCPFCLIVSAANPSSHPTISPPPVGPLTSSSPPVSSASSTSRRSPAVTLCPRSPYPLL